MKRTFSNTPLQLLFYFFLGFHSLLIGLFPFFLPVYLLESAISFSRICWFIGLTGVGFCVTLWVWDRLRKKLSFYSTVAFSFIVELLLLLLLVFGVEQKGIELVALVNGCYNCLFWMVQRILFQSTIDSNNSGRKFGNFQIFVMVLLKIGIFIGGLLLDFVSITGIFIMSCLISVAALWVLRGRTRGLAYPEKLQNSPPVKVTELFAFSDSLRSRWIFVVDGIFLYLESYFWLISLFLFVQHSFTQLGLLVIALAVLFGILFFCIKNRIDRSNRQRVYLVAVALYSLSWGLRGLIHYQLPQELLFLLLVTITFCTSFFRLALNKRFFDISLISGDYRYLFIKSYFSQFFLGLFFSILALTLGEVFEMEMLLSKVYWAALPLSLVYLGYRAGRDGGEVKS